MTKYTWSHQLGLQTIGDGIHVSRYEGVAARYQVHRFSNTRWRAVS